MGIFSRSRRPSRTRVAEGGLGAASESASSTAAAGKKADDNLDLFGADSDESDDDATIDRYANTDGHDGGLGDGGDEMDMDELESKKVSVLLTRMSPEELFKRYDKDGSGNISVDEFLAMLPDLGIKMSEAKAIRIFKMCDTDGGGEIDLNEFRTAMFAVDPVSGNTLGFAPTSLLAPKDAFELFDSDGTGQIDELEFADVLEYYGMSVSDEKQESIFKKYDRDKSGYIEYSEFRAMWIRLVNVRDELGKRGIEIPKYATPWKLQHMLEEALDEEEAREAKVLDEAQRFLYKQREVQQRVELGRRAVIRAQDELAAALDAAGQVYVLGTGKYDQFAGEAVRRDESEFPGFKAVSEIWASRVDPPARFNHMLADRKSSTPGHQEAKTSHSDGLPAEQGAQSSSPKAASTDAVVTRKANSQNDSALPRGSKYVRRRPENKRWITQSAPKLNRETIHTLRDEVCKASRPPPQELASANPTIDADGTRVEILGSNQTVSTPQLPSAGVETSIAADDDHEQLARMFYTDREFVRSLRFRSTVLMKNTGSLWGRGGVQGAISVDVALVATRSGSIFTWGGKNAIVVKQMRVSGLDDDSDDGPNETEQQVVADDPAQESEYASDKVTPRSTLIKMCTKEQMKDVADPSLEAREEETLEAERQQQLETERYESLKRVVVYYDAWELPPSNATRMLFMEQVLFPRLTYDSLLQSVLWRGLIAERTTKMDLILLLAECFNLEIEVKGTEGHDQIKAQETAIKKCIESKEKQVKLMAEPEKEKLVQMWGELREIRAHRLAQAEEKKKQEEIARITRTDALFEAMIARRHVQMEDLTPEYTARGTNAKVELSGITSRGPALHSPRGRVAVADVSLGGSHAALLMHDGSLYTWGVGSSGRLGHLKNKPRVLCFDSNHPQLMDAFQDVGIRQVACAHSHSAAVGTDGSLYVWGSATGGKLGLGVVEEQYEQATRIPVTVKFPGTRRIRFVSCGASHTGAVSTAGELFMWGCANGGRLGLGEQVRDTVVVPTLVRQLVASKERVWQVSCGSSHSMLCTETVSEQQNGGAVLLGGHVYVCGGAVPLGRFVTSWERVGAVGLSNVAIRQVSCGATHSAAVSAYGELYTWGRNEHGCTGHDVERAFIGEPEVVRSLHVEPFNVARGKSCQQISVYNEQGPQRAVNGDVDGRLARCTHTQMEAQAWWQVDLGQPAAIERIRVWNRTDTPTDPSRRRDEYTARLFPFWILVSEFPFKALEGKEGLRAAKVQSVAFDEFHEDRRMTEWVLPPTAQTIGQYVRVQLQHRSFLHLAEVEVFGVYSAFKYVGRVGSVHCGNAATLVVVPPATQQSTLDDFYLRAIQADADNATILRQFEAYERSYRQYGRGDGAAALAALADKCRLCRALHPCEICAFASAANVARFRDERGELPRRLVGDRLGLAALIQLTVDDRELEAEAAANERRREEEESLQKEKQKQMEKERALAASAPPGSGSAAGAVAMLRRVRLPTAMRSLTAPFRGATGK